MLVPFVLQNEVLKLTNPAHPDFRGYATTYEQAATAWAEALLVYLRLQAFPLGAPLAVEGVRTAAEAAYAEACDRNENPLDPMLDVFATAIALASGGTKPPGDPPFQAALAPFLVAPTADPTPPSIAVATTVDAWMRTGSAPNPAAGGATTPWS